MYWWSPPGATSLLELGRAEAVRRGEAVAAPAEVSVPPPAEVGESQCDDLSLEYASKKSVQEFKVVEGNLIVAGATPLVAAAAASLDFTKMRTEFQTGALVACSFGESAPAASGEVFRKGIVLPPLTRRWKQPAGSQALEEAAGGKNALTAVGGEGKVVVLDAVKLASFIEKHGRNAPTGWEEMVAAKPAGWIVEVRIEDCCASTLEGATECAISCISAAAGTGAGVLLCGITLGKSVIVGFASPPTTPTLGDAALVSCVSKLSAMHVLHLAASSAVEEAGRAVVVSHPRSDCVLASNLDPQFIELLNCCVSVAKIKDADASRDVSFLARRLDLLWSLREVGAFNTNRVEERLREMWRDEFPSGANPLTVQRFKSEEEELTTLPAPGGADVGAEPAWGVEAGADDERFYFKIAEKVHECIVYSLGGSQDEDLIKLAKGREFAARPHNTALDAVKFMYGAELRQRV